MSEAGIPRSRRVVWGREVPFHNVNFTGRERELAELRTRLVDHEKALLSQPAQPVYGMGGIGKTEIATEYAHRFRDQYDLVWWIRAEQEETIVDSLIALGKRMRLTDFTPAERDISTDMVLDALYARDPFRDWLLVFDNAQTAADVAPYLPRGGGHVIITSRDQHWRKALNLTGIEVGEFETGETIAFLRKRVPGMSEEDATLLAAELGNLPLAVDHAGAYLVETGSSAADYVAAFRKGASELTSEALDMPYPRAVATTWSLASARLSPEARALFTLLAFISPEPISAEILVQPTVTKDLPSPLDQALSGMSAYRRAVRELTRFSLVKMDAARNIVQLHRVVQAITKDRLEREDPAAARESTNHAHLLLAASDPSSPDREDAELLYQRSRQHLVPSGALTSAMPQLRRLIINQVQALHAHGGYKESLRLGEPTLEVWTERFGPDDRQTLALALQVAIARRKDGDWPGAHSLTADTLARLRRVYGETDPITLNCAHAYSVVLRMLGRYQEALDLDQSLLAPYTREFGHEDQSVLWLRNNIAINLRCLGRFEEALQQDQENLAERLRTIGPEAKATLISKFGIARDLRRLGRYEEALDLITEVNDIMESKHEPWNLFRLLSALDLSVALRRMGYYPDAFQQATMALRRHRSLFGPLHRQTLQAATNTINDYRCVEDLAEAQKLGEETLAGWERIAGRDHPNTWGTCVNLAVVVRLRGNPVRASELDRRAREGLIGMLGPEHPSSLLAGTNLASDLAVMGQSAEARELGEEILELSRRSRGAEHWMTLAIMANLSLDRRADRDERGAAELRAETLAAYQGSLLPDHPDVRLFQQHNRINVDIEPMSD
ncbi:FxSxx-COOH system tetratricopeptide repeat protein [Nonomuraea sp. NPDC050310]|uniref:FxSxx-COOH system tetratricopeptide repeat protein n=1 Tax=Nonomuraea sp. NPDC050310 TaxID=3154935 RepID=UPI003408D051